jgi:cell division protein FtsB
MSRKTPTTALERRRRELEAEEARLRKQIKQLERGGPATLEVRAAATAGFVPHSEGPNMVDPEASVREARRQNIAHFLSSGSFGSSEVPLSHERRVQRNKAIFMLILASLAVFILVQAIW